MRSPAPNLEWGLLLERQIILEILRDSEQNHELEVLRDRLIQREVRNVRPAFPDPCEIAVLATERCSHDPERIPMEPLAQRLSMETDHWIDRLYQVGKDQVGCELERLTQPDRIFIRPDGSPVTSDTQTRYWGMWFPGCFNDHLTLQSVLDTLPGVAEDSIPEAVSELESPESPDALPGAVSLAWHDVLHVILGRGLLDQDEAFVIGFTMGNASRYRHQDGERMKEAFSERYPEPFRVYGKKLRAFELGVAFGRSLQVRDLADRENEHSALQSIGKLRAQFGITSEQLQHVYTREHAMIPGTLESARIPRLF